MIGKVPEPYKAPAVPAKAPIIPAAPTGPFRNTAAPSVLGVIAPNDRVVNWPQISSVSKPFNDPSPTEFGFWFNYFWGEAVKAPNLTKAQQVRISEVFLSIFTPATTRNPQTGIVTVDQPAAYRLRGDFVTRNWEFQENALRQLLIIGFRRVALTAPPPPKRHGFKMGSGLMVAQEASSLNFEMVGDPDGERFPIGFRSDTRSYEDLAKHGGFKTRAREDEKSVFYTGSAMDQPWHPFNNPVYKNSLFLRIGEKNKDNCLNTVISVGPNLKDIVHFPILNDAVLIFTTKSADGQFLALKPLVDWTDADIQLAAAHRYNIEAKKAGGVVDRLEKKNTMHVFHLKGLKGVNTMSYFGGNDAFNERGMAEVPPDHLLAEIPMTQKYYYRDDKGKIDLFQIDFGQIRWVPSPQVADAKLGRNALLRLGALIEGQLGQVAAIYAPELARYQLVVANRATQMNAVDKQNLVAQLNIYYAVPNAKPLMRLEKAEMKIRLPSLSAKIDAIGSLEWVDYRKLAQGK